MFYEEIPDIPEGIKNLQCFLKDLERGIIMEEDLGAAKTIAINTVGNCFGKKIRSTTNKKDPLASTRLTLIVSIKLLEAMEKIIEEEKKTIR